MSEIETIKSNLFYDMTADELSIVEQLLTGDCYELEISKIPKRIVYQIIVDGETAYIGQSRELGVVRALDHGFTRGVIRFIEVPSDLDISKIESAAILKETPVRQRENRRFKIGNPLRSTPPLSVSTSRYFKGSIV